MPPISSEPGPDPITRADYNALIAFANSLETALQAEVARAAAAEAALDSRTDALEGDLGNVTPAPAAAFVASVQSGVVPFLVDFTDTSLNNPTSWSWNFGDGGTATTRNPSHTYSVTGTYTVTLTATNAGGSDTSTLTITASAPTGSGSVSVIASTSTGSASAVTAVSLTTPAGIATGDLMVAVIVADNVPTISGGTGWTLDTSTPISASTGVTMWVYWKIATSSEPGPYTWTLGTAQKWNGGITIFRGNDTTNPWDTAAATVDYDTAVSSISAPSITTVTPNGMAVNVVGVNSPGADVSSASGSGFTEAWEADGGQTARLSTKPLTTAGLQPPTVANLVSAQTAVGWVRAIRRSGATAPATGPKLTWAPPALTNPAVINIATGDRVIMLPDRDCLIVWPNYPLRISNDFQFVGGRNIVSIGGEVRCTTAGRQMIVIGRTINDRIVHVEGLKFTVDAGVKMTEGINIDAGDDTGLDVRFQNCILAPAYGTQAGVHADVIQAYNGPKTLKLDLFEGSSSYQGFMVQPGQNGEDVSYPGWDFRRCRITMIEDNGIDPGYFMMTTNEPYPTVAFDDVQIKAPSGWSKLTKGSPSSSTPPANPTTGLEIVSAFSGARATAGVGYVSPGYL